MTECDFAGCDRARKSHGLCNAHNEQRRLGKQLTPLKKKSFATIEAKFEMFVVRTDGCWEWSGTVNDSGYAMIAKNHKYYRAHRISWELTHGPIPAGMVIDHMCHTRTCTNPNHLRVVTQAENNENRAGANSNSLIGIRNVSKHGTLYRVTLMKDRKTIRVGSYATLEEANRAAEEARRVNFIHSEY